MLAKRGQGGVEHYTGRELERLRREHPMFEFWVIHRAVDGQTWCARPGGLEKPIYNADSPEELVQRLEVICTPDPRLEQGGPAAGLPPRWPSHQGAAPGPGER